MQNESETEFHRVYKVSPTQQLTKLTHLLRESGAAVLLVCVSLTASCGDGSNRFSSCFTDEKFQWLQRSVE